MSTPHHPITLYGVPRDPLGDITPPGWIKFGLHGRDDRVADPSSMSRLVTEQEQQELQEAANVSLHCSSSSSSSISSAKPCLYTMSPDGHFLLGRPSEYKRVVAASGLSGHGFKMTPALGEMLCDLVLGEDFDKWNAESLSPSRFQA
ncbi:sarcosine oxidase [Fragilaria crotonensis]|nr:sarcosine oxidase [Fragilaria crotonensis]